MNRRQFLQGAAGAVGLGIAGIGLESPNVRDQPVPAPRPSVEHISGSFRNEVYVAERVFPAIPVAKAEDFLIGREGSVAHSGVWYEMLRLDKPLPFFARERAFMSEKWDYSGSGGVNGFELTYPDAAMLMDRLMLDNEVAVADIVCDRSRYPQKGRFGPGTDCKWSSYDSSISLPLNDLKHGKRVVAKTFGREANCLLLSPDAAAALDEHPSVKDMICCFGEPIPGYKRLRPVLRGLEVIIGNARRNMAAGGQYSRFGDVWRADDGTAMALVFYRNPKPSPRDSSLGYTLDAPDDTFGIWGVSTMQWRDESRKSDMIEARFTRDWQMVNPMAGYLMTNLV